jgi:hypothetical protein
MIKAEIRTDAGNYVVSLENTETFQGGLSLVQTKLDEGLPFTGDDGYLLICNGSKLKHIRIFEVSDDVIPFMDDASDDVEQPPKGAYVFKTDRAEFLGHKLTVTGQALEVDGHTYYLPMEVNNNPALMTMGPEKLEEFLDYWLMSRQVDYDSYTVVIPAAQLPDYEEALEYVRDYAKETAGDYTPKERNARAWQEWKGNE